MLIYRSKKCDHCSSSLSAGKEGECDCQMCKKKAGVGKDYKGTVICSVCRGKIYYIERKGAR